MHYARLGSSGLTVSRLSLGAMTFGTGEFGGFRYQVDQQLADRMVGLALDAGINTLDTADMYASGQSEEILGRAVAATGRRDKMIIATKVGVPLSDDLNSGGLSYRHIVNGAEASLRRLGVDHIDLFQLHSPDFATPLEETLQALTDLVRRGLVRYVGWSNFPAWYAAEAHALQRERHWPQFVSAQVYYSLVGRDVEHDILPHVRRAGTGTLIWSPLASGFLSGKYTRQDPLGWRRKAGELHLSTSRRRARLRRRRRAARDRQRPRRDARSGGASLAACPARRHIADRRRDPH